MDHFFVVVRNGIYYKEILDLYTWCKWCSTVCDFTQIASSLQRASAWTAKGKTVKTKANNLPCRGVTTKNARVSAARVTTRGWGGGVSWRICCGSIGHFRVPPGLCIKTRLGAQPLTWKWFFILMQIKLISTRKVEHLTELMKLNHNIYKNSLNKFCSQKDFVSRVIHWCVSSWLFFRVYKEIRKELNKSEPTLSYVFIRNHFF